MQITIYQVNMNRDTKRNAFESLEHLEKFQGSSDVDSSLYDKVYEGDVDCADLEDVYQMFNLNHPKDYLGRSLSVSDVVEVKDGDSSKFYFCDSVGFAEVPFQPELTSKIENELLRVVLIEPGKQARVTDIDASFKMQQRIVGGNLHTYEPYQDGTVIVYNEDGKLEGLPPNRAIREPESVEEMNYRELKERFRAAERDREGKHLTGYIVFSQDSFTQPYSEESRTYEVSSDNKAFQPNMGGYSIYGSAIDGSDPNVRVEKYMEAEQGGKEGWKVERCYMKQPGREIMDVIHGTAFICATDGEKFVSLTDEQAKKYQVLFKLPEQFFKDGDSIEAIPYKPKDKSQER